MNTERNIQSTTERVVYRLRDLYEKYGFRVVSEKPKAFKCKDGRYRSEFYMQKYLCEI